MLDVSVEFPVGEVIPLVVVPLLFAALNRLILLSRLFICSVYVAGIAETNQPGGEASSRAEYRRLVGLPVIVAAAAAEETDCTRSLNTSEGI